MPLAQAKARPSLAPSVPGLWQRATNEGGYTGGALPGPSTPGALLVRAFASAGPDPSFSEKTTASRRERDNFFLKPDYQRIRA
ncbi:MAG: hypothetical protein DMG06_26130 [Acidobacteria bacterium]|nr:MAG: hypothetical protein DMG06_26130 [Acidobacteriota bacterium]